MEFNRLSEVEKLAEVPAGASALAESDGKIVRVPFGGGVSLEDIMFDLESSIGTESASIANVEQLQKVIDRNMTVRVVAFQDVSNSRMADVFELPVAKETLVHTGASDGVVYCTVKSSASAYMQVYADADAYEADGEIVVVNGAYIYVPSGYTVTRVYASIF